MDEPSNGELARRLDKIELLLQGLVSRLEYTTDQRHLEHRFGEVERDIADLRRVHEEDIKDVKKRIENDGQSRGSNVRQAIFSGLIPGVLFLVSILLTLSQSRGK